MTNRRPWAIIALRRVRSVEDHQMSGTQIYRPSGIVIRQTIEGFFAGRYQDAGLEIEDKQLARPVDRWDHALGPEDAPITLVMYGDYLCPRTRQAWPVLEELLEDLGDRLRLVFRHFPTGGAILDPQAAETAEAAGVQGRFWEMHKALFQASQVIEGPLLARYAAAKVDLDRPKLERQVQRRIHAGKVLEDAEGGRESGVRETPAFFVNGLRHDETYLLRVLLAAQ